MGMPRRRNYSGRWETLIAKCTKCLNSLLEIAAFRRRNYIIDQVRIIFLIKFYFYGSLASITEKKRMLTDKNVAYLSLSLKRKLYVALGLDFK